MLKIILPTDFSDNSWNAIFTTLKLYAKISCKFYLLHVYEPKQLNFIGKSSQQRLGIIYDSLSKYTEQELEKMLIYLNKNHINSNHSIETISKADTLNEALDSIIIGKDIDLIAMGTQGATGAKEIFIGSTTVKVLKHIKKRPVLVIPSGYHFQQLKTLVFSTNFDRAPSKSELLPLSQLAAIWKANIQILHITSEFRLSAKQKINKERIEERLVSIPYSHHHMAFEISLSKTIAKYIVENEVNLMVMMRNQHSFWEKFIREPVVKKTAFHSAIPVLMLPEG
ncbi:universal stress protein [Cellulophaga sp. Hel_I_12]|uniref:universal stress protein n=1 Tax=Cellulophaga sp. Hel_I_12 TaxID=1249972 RepID=UPI0006473E74|nr:universal stress protein [Cellulophaga sp. Hel_I_12]